MRHYTDQEVRDLLVTAHEGGIGYWSQTSDYDYERPEEATIWEDTDEDGEGDTPHKLTLDQVDAAMVHFQMNPSAYMKGYCPDVREADAIVADMVVQQAIFGEVVYG